MSNLSATLALILAAVTSAANAKAPPATSSYEPPRLERGRWLAETARPAEVDTAGSIGRRLDGDTVALRLYDAHAGDWELDLEQRPRHVLNVCQQVILTWEIGRPRGLPRHEPQATAIIDHILQHPEIPIRDMRVHRRFQRLRSDQPCVESSTAKWIEAPNFSDFLSVTGSLQQLRTLDASGDLARFSVSCVDMTGRPCAAPRERLRAFLRGEVFRVRQERGNRHVAIRRDAGEQVVVTYGTSWIERIEVQELGLPPL